MAESAGLQILAESQILSAIRCPIESKVTEKIKTQLHFCWLLQIRDISLQVAGTSSRHIGFSMTDPSVDAPSSTPENIPVFLLHIETCISLLFAFLWFAAVATCMYWWLKNDRGFILRPVIVTNVCVLVFGLTCFFSKTIFRVCSITSIVCYEIRWALCPATLKSFFLHHVLFVCFGFDCMRLR